MGNLGVKAGSDNFCTIVRYDKATTKTQLVYELCIESEQIRKTL